MLIWRSNLLIMPSQKDIQFIQGQLLSWFKQHQRDLPWRKAYEPYQVWISEIMLQQTQVKTVLPYFERWMKTLPTVADVAQAPEDQILKLWEGLGYYSRARNLQKAAKVIMAEHEGVFPSDYASVLALPGIGKYTAGAIMSIAFNQDEALVDGNVIRVLSRLFFYQKNTRLPEAERQMWEWARGILPSGEARYFNQAMMELGALICSPKAPNCEICPLQAVCKAREKGKLNQIPNRGPKKELQRITVALGVIKKEGKVFIQKRPEKGLMAGLWEFPGGKVEKGETKRQALKREVAEELGIQIRDIKKIKQIKHAYTSFKVDLHCFEAQCESADFRLNSAVDGRWVKPSELKNYPFPAANVRLIEELDT